MTTREQDRQRWVQRLRAAATEATDSGATLAELTAALHAGVEDGRRRQAARNAVPAPRRTADSEDRAREFTPAPGSALADLLRATGHI